MKEGGTLYVTVKEGEGEGLVFIDSDDTRFFSNWKREELEKAVRDAGFGIEMSYTEIDKTPNWINIFATARRQSPKA